MCSSGNIAWRRGSTARLTAMKWYMTPPTINAYYTSTFNSIASFRPAILQPPFFDPKADDAVNYGGIMAL